MYREREEFDLIIVFSLVINFLKLRIKKRQQKLGRSHLERLMTCDYTRMQLTVLLLQGKRKESMIFKDSFLFKFFFIFV